MKMRRFLFLLLLLVLTLLIGRELEAAEPRDDDWDEPDGRRIEFHGSFDLDDDEEDAERTSRTRTYPRRRGDDVVFRLPDRGYERVFLAGDFTDWEPIPMQHVERRDYWEASAELGGGSHRYAFLVEDADGSRDRRDPANPRRARHEGRWVSEIVIGKNHRVLRPRDEYEFEFLSDIGADFQRVDGFSLFTKPHFDSNVPWSPSFTAELGYGFSSERWSGGLRFRQPLLESDLLAATLSLYDETAYTDQTGVGDVENALSSWIFREDSRDYYRREGLSLGLSARPTDDLKFELQFRADDYRSLPVATTAGWNVGRDRFLENPEIDEGTMRSIVARAQFGDDERHFWLRYERSDDALFSTGYDFTQLTAQYRTRFRLGRHQRLDLRARAGSNFSGKLPVQKRYVLGGIGTVRGYRYQSLLSLDPAIVRSPGDPLPLGGERMFLFNAEYAITVDHDMSLVLLYDSGMAWEDRDADIDPAEFANAIGVGIVFDDDDYDDTLRIDLIKTLDEDDDDIMVQARLSRPF
jgi:hypothetical protein